MKKLLSFFLVIVLSLTAIIALVPPIEASAAVSSGRGKEIWDINSGGKRDFMWPVLKNYGISGCFMDGRSHYGLDIPASKGTTVVSSFDGKVVIRSNSCTHNYYKSRSEYCGCGGGLGNYVVIEHSYVLLDGTRVKLYTRYSHLTEVSVSNGSFVNKGDKIGTVGSTGNSQGFHLHYQVMLKQSGNKTQISIDPYINNILELPSGVYTASTPYCCGMGPTGCCCYYYIKDIKQVYSVALCSHSKYEGVGVCIECGKTYDWRGTFTADAGTYKVAKDFTPRSDAPYDAGTKASTSIKKGTSLTVTGYYINAFGNKWYVFKYDDGKLGYVFHKYLELVSYNRLNVVCTGFTPSENKSLPLGEGYPVCGTVSSNYPLKKVVAKLDGNEYATWTAPNNTTTSFEINPTNINHSLKFGSLSAGEHTITLIATDLHGRMQTFLTRSFDIIPKSCKHSYRLVFDDAKHTEQCSLCGETRNEATHTLILILSTFDTPIANSNNHYMRCTVCDYWYIFSHEYVNSCSSECSVCKSPASYREPVHTYDGKCDTSCNSCGLERIVTHDFDAGRVTKQPTENEKGCITSIFCITCGKEQYKEIDALIDVYSTEKITDKNTSLESEKDTNDVEGASKGVDTQVTEEGFDFSIILYAVCALIFVVIILAFWWKKVSGRESD